MSKEVAQREEVVDGHRVVVRVFSSVAKPRFLPKKEWLVENAAVRETYSRAWGPIAPGWHIHHVDSNNDNNDPANLVAMPPVVRAAVLRHVAKPSRVGCLTLTGWWVACHKQKRKKLLPKMAREYARRFPRRP